MNDETTKAVIFDMHLKGAIKNGGEFL